MPTNLAEAAQQRMANMPAEAPAEEAPVAEQGEENADPVQVATEALMAITEQFGENPLVAQALAILQGGSQTEEIAAPEAMRSERL